MRQRYRARSGRAIGYLLVGLLGGILGGVVSTWMVGRQGVPLLGQSEHPYTTTPAPAAPISEAGGASVVRAVQVVGPAVVNIDTIIGSEPSRGGDVPDALRRLLPFREPEEPMPSQGRGSGMIIDGKRGLVLTNNHVAANARTIKVFLPDKRSFDATVKGTDPYGDVALLKVNSENLPEVKLGNSDNLPIGSTAIAIGNPFGFENSVTVGVVSAVNRELPGPTGVRLGNLIQTDAAINPGNSGGPLCDINGNVIAMNTAIIPSAQGLGFAVAVNAIKHSLDEIEKYGRAIYPWMGIQFVEISQDVAHQLGLRENQGVLVTAVVGGSPANRAGVRERDVITAINGKKIVSENDLRTAIRRAGVGQTVTLTGYRDGRVIDFQIKLGEMPPPDQLQQR